MTEEEKKPESVPFGAIAAVTFLGSLFTYKSFGEHIVTGMFLGMLSTSVAVLIINFYDKSKTELSSK